MKRLAAISILLCLISTSAIAQSTKNSLMGTWRLISTTGQMGDQKWNEDSSSLYQIKTITPSRFMFTTYSSSLTDSLIMSAQGPITVNGNIYTETIDRSTSKGIVGVTFKYTSTVKGNKWHIEGGSADIKLVEDWVKVE